MICHRRRKDNLFIAFLSFLLHLFTYLLIYSLIFISLFLPPSNLLSICHFHILTLSVCLSISVSSFLPPSICLSNYLSSSYSHSLRLSMSFIFSSSLSLSFSWNFHLHNYLSVYFVLSILIISSALFVLFSSSYLSFM